MSRYLQIGAVIRSGMSPDSLLQFCLEILPDGDFRRIVLKPNWVIHQTCPEFPITALVTSSALIDAVVAACLAKYPAVEQITIGDVPLQSCDWESLCKQAGISELVAKYASEPRVRFLDLRRERFILDGGFMRPQVAEGDPKGYSEVVLEGSSFLEEVSQRSGQFRVSDYDPKETTSMHAPGKHRYLIANSVLDSDLFINLPKMKTHQKAGITGALKNLVGVNGHKAYLVHHRQGTVRSGGDEFPPDVNPVVMLQVRLREYFQKRSATLFKALRLGWKFLRSLCGIETLATREKMVQSRQIYVGAGSWYGNDTIWRMIFDLNRIIRFAPRGGGRLADVPQREYLAIMDGIVAGEGNGPLQPLPVDLQTIIAGADPFLVDCCMARLMGFDEQKIPSISKRRVFGHAWGAFDANNVEIEFNGRNLRGVGELPVLHRFIPPPGWKSQIEMEDEVRA